MTVPLPNISQRRDLTIKEGLEASLEGAQRPGGQKTILTLPLAKGNSFKTSLTSPPTKDTSFTDKKKIPPIANDIQLKNSKEEKRFRREKKKKMKSQAKAKKKYSLQAKETGSTTTRAPFYPTPRPDQQKEYTYIVNHTQLVPIEPEAPEPIFWNEEAVKLKILGADDRENHQVKYRAAKNRERRRKTVNKSLIKTENQQVRLKQDEYTKNNQNKIDLRHIHSDGGFGMRYQSFDNKRKYRYNSDGSKRIGLGNKNYKNRKRTFSNYISDGNTLGRAKERSSVHNLGDDYSSLLKNGKSQMISPFYDEPYQVGQNRRSSFFENKKPYDTRSYKKGLTTRLYPRRDNLGTSGLQRESPKIVGWQQDSLLGFLEDPEDLEFGFVPSELSLSAVAQKEKETQLRSNNFAQNPAFKYFDPNKLYKPTKRRTHKKDQNFLGQPEIAKDNDMKLLDYYRSEYSLEEEDVNANDDDKLNNWKPEKHFKTRSRQPNPNDQEFLVTHHGTVDEYQVLKDFYSPKKVKSKKRNSFYRSTSRPSPIHVDKFVSHSSSGEGVEVEENVYIVYPDETLPNQLGKPSYVSSRTPSLRSGRTINKVVPSKSCQLEVSPAFTKCHYTMVTNENFLKVWRGPTTSGESPWGYFSTQTADLV